MSKSRYVLWTLYKTNVKFLFCILSVRNSEKLFIGGPICPVFLTKLCCGKQYNKKTNEKVEYWLLEPRGLLLTCAISGSPNSCANVIPSKIVS